MVKIRLARHGRKKAPVYRIVAVSGERKREGKPLAILGHWHPAKDVLKIKRKEIDAWVAKGAQVSAAVSKLLK